MIAFLRCFTVSKYNEVEKKISYSESASNNTLLFEVLLKEIRTVKRVNINPQSVKDTVHRSESKDIITSSLGIMTPNLLTKYPAALVRRIDSK